MTTIGQTPRTGPVTANGVTTEFTFTFRVLDEDEVVVVVTDVLNVVVSDCHRTFRRDSRHVGLVAISW